MKKLKDTDIQVIIGWVLRIGVFVSMTVVFIGGIFYIYRHGHEIADYRIFKGVPIFVQSGGGIINGIFTLRGRAMIQAGIIFINCHSGCARGVFGNWLCIRERLRLCRHYPVGVGYHNLQHVERPRRLIA